VPRRRDDHQLVAGEDLGHQVVALDKALSEAHVQLVPGQAPVNLLGVADLHGQLHPRVSAPELCQHGGEQVVADRRAGPEHQLPLPADPHVGQGLFRLARQAEQPARVLLQEEACLAQEHPATDAVKLVDP
jgi:hypothetical protein